MRTTLSIVGLTAAFAGILLLPHASAQSSGTCGPNSVLCSMGTQPRCVDGEWQCVAPSSAFRNILLATIDRLDERLKDRGVDCGKEPDRFGCGALRRLAERVGRLIGTSSSSVRSSSSKSSSSRSSVSSSSMSTSSVSSGQLDPMSDTTLGTSFFALFGETTPMVASVQAFINEEALNVTDIRITLTGSSRGVDFFYVYDQNRRLIGRASKSGSEYVLSMQPGAFTIPRREYTPLYVRAKIGDFDRNSDGVDSFGVLTVTIEGTGEWSSDTYTKAFSDTFPTVQPSGVVLTGLRNGGPQTDFVTEGTLDIFDLRGNAKVTGGLAQARFNSIVFTVAKSDVTLSNVSLTVIGTGVSSPCTVGATTITCDSIPASIGTVRGDFRLVLQGTVDITTNVDNARLQVFIQDPGTPTSAGDIAWSDGISDYDWVPFATPVVRGTYFTR